MKRLTGAAVPLMATAAAFLFGAVMILAVGADPVLGFKELLSGAFGSGERLATTAVRAAPLLLVGAGIAVAFRASVINIGGEGQILAGALLSTVTAQLFPTLPAVVLLPLVLLAGLVGGAIWGAIPGALKAYASVNEILSTIMFNIVAIQIMNFLLRGPMIDPEEVARGTAIPQTERLSENADLPILIEGTRLHLGVVVALLAAVVAYILLWRTPLGFRLRAVGHSPEAAHSAGIRVKPSIVMALAMSGALSGLAGAILVFGSEAHRMGTDGSAAGFTGAAGFNGIVAALFGGLHPLWTIPSAFLFGGLLAGATHLQRALQVPAALAVALNGIVVVFVVSSGRVRSQIDRILTARQELRDFSPEESPLVGVDP